MTITKDFRTLAVAEPTEWKRALLLFDRVWWHHTSVDDKTEQHGVPKELVYSHPETDLRAGDMLWGTMKKELIGESGKSLQEMIAINSSFTVRIGMTSHWFLKTFQKTFCQAYSELGFCAIPIYLSTESFESDFSHGNETAYQAVLSSMPVVAIENVEWKQILQFRNDQESLGHYRALRTFITQSLVSKSLQEAQDILGRRLDLYSWAIRKHGFETLSGSISSIVDSKFLVSLAGTAGVTNVFAGPIWAACSTGALVVSKVVVEISKRYLASQDLRRGPLSEVALIFDANKQFKGKQPNQAL